MLQITDGDLNLWGGAGGKEGTERLALLRSPILPGARGLVRTYCMLVHNKLLNLVPPVLLHMYYYTRLQQATPAITGCGRLAAGVQEPAARLAGQARGAGHRPGERRARESAFVRH